MKSRSAASARLPNFVEPMKAKLIDSIQPAEWIYEIKFDGYRALALRGCRVALNLRNGDRLV